jgi:hypothetical protein
MTSKPKWWLSQLENFHCSHRRPAGLSFPGLYFSLNQHSIETLNFLNTHDSLESLNFHHSVLQSHHLGETPLSEAQPGRKRAPTPEELRWRLPHTFRRIITVHPRATFGPTEPRDVFKPVRGVTSIRNIAPCAVQRPGKPPL